jgi:hypothetical protein
MPKDNLQPDVIARPAVVGGSQANNIMLPVFEGAIVGNAAVRLSEALGRTIGLAGEYAKHNAVIERKEQGALMLTGANSYSSDMSKFIDDSGRDATIENNANFKDKFEKHSTELKAKYAKGLNPVGLKMFDNAIASKKQTYLNTYSRTYEQKLDVINKEAKKATLQQNTKDAIAILPGDGEDDLSMDESIASVQAFSRSQGYKATRESVQKFAKTNGITVAENFMTGDLGAYQRILQKDLTALKKAEKPDEKEIEKKDALLGAVNSIIVSEKAVQDNIDTVQAGRYDNYIKAGDLVSAKNLVDNASPGGGGKYKTSPLVLSKLKENLTKHQGVQKVTSVCNEGLQLAYAGFNPLKDNEADLVTKVAEVRREIGKKFSGSSLNDQKSKKTALARFDTAVRTQNQAHKAALLAKQSEILNFWKDKKMNAMQIDEQIGKLAPELNAEFVGKLRALAKNYTGQETSTPGGIMKQRQISFDALQAARDGFGMYNGQKIEINNEGDFFDYYLLTGGVNSVQKASALSKQYRNKEQTIDKQTLDNVLSAFGNKKLDDFVARGGAEAVSRMLPAGEVASYKDTYDAVAKWLNQEIHEDNYWNSTGSRKDNWSDATHQYVSKGEMEKRYMIEHGINYAPGFKELKQFGDNKGFKFNDTEEVWRLDVEDKYRFIKDLNRDKK